jgi:biotin operon repressor
MKEYKLAGWPDLPPVYQRIAYRRMLSDMSQRYVSMPKLAKRSGLSRHEVRQFIEMLDSRGMLLEHDSGAPDSILDSLRPLGGWIRRAFSAHT